MTRHKLWISIFTQILKFAVAVRNTTPFGISKATRRLSQIFWTLWPKNIFFVQGSPPLAPPVFSFGRRQTCFYYFYSGGFTRPHPPFFSFGRLPRTPCSYDQREGSGEPPSGFVDAERHSVSDTQNNKSLANTFALPGVTPPHT